MPPKVTPSGVMINGKLTIARLLNTELSFDPARLCSAKPDCHRAAGAGRRSAAADASGASPKAFLETARQAGSRWNYGPPCRRNHRPHIGLELTKVRTAIAAVPVPYPGDPQAIGAMLGGQIQIALCRPGWPWPR